MKTVCCKNSKPSLNHIPENAALMDFSAVYNKVDIHQDKYFKLTHSDVFFTLFSGHEITRI